MVNGLMRGSHKDRADYFSVMRNQAGAMTGNEVRAYEDLNPLPGGDDLWRPMNTEVVGAPSDTEEN
jgi:hypothetical protein